MFDSPEADLAAEIAVNRRWPRTCGLEPERRCNVCQDIFALGVSIVIPLIFCHPSIENPLGHLTPEQLLRDVRDFARSKNLESHLDLLKKGAQIAKDPRFYEAVPGITEDEKKALRDEDYHRFRQPMALYITIITCSVGAAVQ